MRFVASARDDTPRGSTSLIHVGEDFRRTDITLA
jgi:hypothetical protein